MIAKLFARKIADGELTYDKVPSKLKKQVKKILAEEYGIEV